MRFWLRPIAFTLICGLACGCADWEVARRGTPDATAAEVLWLPLEARLEEDAAQPALVKNGRSVYVDGSGAVVFTIDSERDGLSTRIVEHFAAAGWRERSTQYLNPQLPTSFDLGWQSQCACLSLDSEGNPKPLEPYHQWHGEWENERGDIVEYMLAGDDNQLRGYAAYIPRPVVEEVLGKQDRLGR